MDTQSTGAAIPAMTQLKGTITLREIEDLLNLGRHTILSGCYDDDALQLTVRWACLVEYRARHKANGQRNAALKARLMTIKNDAIELRRLALTEYDAAGY